jgi:hypothetical protein
MIPRRTKAGLLAGLAFIVSLVSLTPSPQTPSHKETRVSLEQKVERISGEERLLIQEALKKIEERYKIKLYAEIVKADLDEDTGGRVKYDNGEPRILLQDLSFYKPNPELLWNSKYMKSPSNRQLYQRAVIHEFGHILYEKVASPEMKRALFDIDAQNDVSEKGSESYHPAHPSFNTFFYAGFKEAYGDKYLDDLVQSNASETFADIFALRVLGLLENPEDELLAKKIELIEGAIKKYPQSPQPK